MKNQGLGSCSSGRAGCKGDPRMNRAVAARLKDPSLSLSQALHIGGFHYPTTDDAAVTDDEMVTLGQRKNQLNRRLRMVRKATVDANQKSPMCRQRGTNTTQIPTSSMQTDDNWLQQISQQYTLNSALYKQTEASTRKGALDNVACKSNSAYATVEVPFSETMPHGCIEAASPASATPPTTMSLKHVPLLDNIHTWGVMASPMTTSQPQTDCELHRQNNDNETVAPNTGKLLRGATNKWTTSFSALMEIEHGEHISADSSATTNRTVPFPYSGREPSTAKAALHATALKLFQKALPELYRDCMFRAGFKRDDTEEHSQFYRRFAFEAWQNECERLQVVLSCDGNDDCVCSTQVSCLK